MDTTIYVFESSYQKLNYMKTLFYSFLAVVAFTFTGFSQEKSTVAVSGTSAEITTGKTSGKFTFIMPEGTTAEEVSHTTKYYTNYFTVEYKETTREAKITMVSNDERSRAVITRFLRSNGVQQVNVGGTLVSMDEFYESYLK